VGWAGSVQMDMEVAQALPHFQTFVQDRWSLDFDRRGVGASQRDVDDLSLEAHLADISALVDHLQLDTFDAFGWGEGAPIAVAYAAQYPERVRRLGLWTPYPRGEDTVMSLEASQAFVQLVRGNWPLARRTLADIVLPSGPDEARRWFSNLLRESISAEVAARYVELQTSIDVRSFLPRIQAPTIVFHRRGDRVIPFSAGRAAAAMIPDARFVALEGDTFHPFFGDTSYLKTAASFFDEGRQEPAPEPSPAPGGLVTILFTDIASSTALTQRLGDAKAQELVRAHNAVVREALAAHGRQRDQAHRRWHHGLLPDGVWRARVRGPDPARHRCAQPRGWEGRPRPTTRDPLAVHIGLNAGEPVAEERDLFGTAVQLARRICDHATSGQILASNVVRELAAGKDFLFSDIGEVVPKGFEEPVRLYEVRWRET
ncbi:MAG: alpha/beta fold hydrolase, partial [Chloroflexi bacterium]|nr:alpha/beta fold hydrolase [Chloroflexota bacterium]